MQEMFGDVSDPRVRVGTKQWYTVPLSILAHTIGIARARGDSAARDGHGADAGSPCWRLRPCRRHRRRRHHRHRRRRAAPSTPQPMTHGDPERRADRGAEGNQT